ncbi:MAG TPA: group II truncated hemoglobin [Myxococcales bacterium]|nr:group II truncated hemoglobin [Myxococcales bacterium]
MSTPFEELGGAPAVRRLVDRFYREMEAHEPELTRLHAMDPDGRISAEFRERFALFLIGWLGGPQDYHQQHGHPRLRMRHAAVPVGEAMRDAWLRSMRRALDGEQVGGELRAFLDARFAEVADFLRNREG